MKGSATGQHVSAGRNSLRRQAYHLRKRALMITALLLIHTGHTTQFKFTEHAWAVSKAVGGI